MYFLFKCWEGHNTAWLVRLSLCLILYTVIPQFWRFFGPSKTLPKSRLYWLYTQTRKYTTDHDFLRQISRILVIFSKSKWATDKFYTSLESPNIWHFKTLKTKGMASIQKLLGPFEWNSNFFHSKGCGCFVWAATSLISRAPNRCILGLSYDGCYLQNQLCYRVVIYLIGKP